MSFRSRILSRIRTMESVPASALKAMRLLQDENANMGEVVQIINYDPGLTSNILKLANSSFFGGSHSIASLREAIIRLGSDNIYKLITAAIANVALNRKIRGYNMTSGDLWEHSIAVAVAAENLAATINSESKNIAFTAGLLHDMGKVILGHFIDRKIAPKLKELLDSGMTFDRAEQELFNINHAELGGLLLEEWQIPETLVNAVRFQYTPETIEDDLPGIVHIANALCIKNNIGSTDRQLDTTLSRPIFGRLKISAEIRDETVVRTKDSLDTIKDVFSKQI